jgi:hypothetical protein
MMMSMRDGPVFQPATTQVIQQPFVQMPGQPPMMVMVPGTGLSMQPAMQLPVQTLTAAAATTAQQPNDTGLQSSKSSSSVDGSGKKTITFK